MIETIRSAVVVLLLLTGLTGLAYPLALTGLAGLLFPHQAGGSLVTRGGAVVGSALIGQNFSQPRYFQPRPSATTAPDPADASKTVPMPYNAANSGASNFAPSAKALVERVTADVAARRAENPGAPVPADLVTTSASGLDPHITPEAALFQVPRVAAARGLPEARVAALVAAHSEGRLAGLVGEPRVNVLALNLALDELR